MNISIWTFNSLPLNLFHLFIFFSEHLLLFIEWPLCTTPSEFSIGMGMQKWFRLSPWADLMPSRKTIYLHTNHKVQKGLW